SSVVIAPSGLSPSGGRKCKRRTHSFDARPLALRRLAFAWLPEIAARIPAVLLGVATPPRLDPACRSPAACVAVHGFGFCGIEASAAPTCPFYQRSTVPVFSGIAGVSFQLAPSTSLAIESGLRSQSNLREDPTDLGFGPFVKDAYTGSRWSIPITTTLRVRF